MKTLITALNKLHEYKNTNGTISMFIKLNKSKAIQGLVFSFSVLSAVFMVPFSHAEGVQMQHLVPFQGRLHGADNLPVQNGRYDITFSLYNTAVGGDLIWSETHNEVSVIQGYTNVVLGAESAFEDSDQNIIDFGRQLYIGISVNQGAELFPRQQLIPSFHAVTANNAKTLGGNTPDHFATAQQVTDLSGDYSEFKSLLNTLELTPRLNEDGSDMKVIDPVTGEPTNTVIVRVEHAKDADTLDGRDSTEFANSNVQNRLLSYFEEIMDENGSVTSSKIKVDTLPVASTTVKGGVYLPFKGSVEPLTIPSNVITGPPWADEITYWVDPNTGVMNFSARLTYLEMYSTNFGYKHKTKRIKLNSDISNYISRTSSPSYGFLPGGLIETTSVNLKEVSYNGEDRVFYDKYYYKYSLELDGNDSYLLVDIKCFSNFPDSGAGLNSCYAAPHYRYDTFTFIRI